MNNAQLISDSKAIRLLETPRSLSTTYCTKNPDMGINQQTEIVIIRKCNYVCNIVFLFLIGVNCCLISGK